MKKKVFISFPAIHREEHYMRKIISSLKELRMFQDYTIISPLNNIDKYGDEEYEEAVAHDLALMIKCDAFYFTKDCERSKLSQVQRAVAKVYDISEIKQLK